jgi:hypothetical protein
MQTRHAYGSNEKPLLFVSAILAFVSSQLLARWLGVRFADGTLTFLYQYLDPAILRDDLARGLFYLHAQPPLFNLFLGGVLKLFPESSRTAFQIFYGCCGLGLLLALTWLMDELGVDRRVDVALVWLLALSPNFMVYTNWLFYTLPVALLVLLGAVVLLRYRKSGGALAAHLFSWCAGVLMLTRAVYHPLWFICVIGVVALLLERPKRRVLLLSAVAPLMVVILWFGKNYMQVGVFGGSSWLGMNLAKRWPLSQAEMDELHSEGHIPPTWHRRPFREPAELQHFRFFQPGRRVHPAVDETYKSTGEPNFNHRDYARISRELLRGDLYLIRHYPDRYLLRTATAFLLFVQPGPNSVDFLVDYDFSQIGRLRDVLTRYLFLGGAIQRPIRMLEPPPNLWLVVFPILVLLGAISVFRRGPLRPVYAYMMVTIIWVTLTTNLIEIGENDRMRWEIEPLLCVLLGVVVTSFLSFFETKPPPRRRG